MSKNNGNLLTPLVDSLFDVGKLAFDGVTTLACKVTGVKTEAQKELEREQAEELMKAREEEDRISKEQEVESKNTIDIKGKTLNFSELFFNCGLKNRLKDMPVLESVRNYQAVDIYSFKLPVGVTVSTVQQRIEEISDFFEVSQMNIKLQKKNGLMDIIITKDNLFNRVFEYSDMGLSKGLKIPVGHFVNQDYMEKMLVIDMGSDNIPHGFIGSTTGGGKSNFIRVMILNWIMNKCPEDIELFLIDGKGGTDYTAFLSAPHIFMNKCFNDEGDVVAILEGAIHEILHRNQLFIKSGANNYDEYTQSHKLPRRVIIFDEYAMYHGSKVYSTIQSKVGKICSTGRSAGVHIIVATQDGRKEILDSMIKYNMPLKIGFKCDNAQHSINISGYAGLETINRIGVGRVFGLPLDTEYVQFKSMKAPSSKDIRDMIFKKYSKYVRENSIILRRDEPSIAEECDIIFDTAFGEECE